MRGGLEDDLATRRRERAPLVFQDEARAGSFPIPSEPRRSRGLWCRWSPSGSWAWWWPRRPCRSRRSTSAVLVLTSPRRPGGGIATARLRQQLQGAEIERERMRLAAEIDGLAQDLARRARALAARLRAATGSPGQPGAAASASARRVECGRRLEDLSVTVPLGGIRAAVEDVSEDRPGAARGPLLGPRRGRLARHHGGGGAGAHRGSGQLRPACRGRARGGTAQIEEDRLTLEISDDGVGFRVADAGGPGDGHFELALMQERARGAGGRLTVRSAPREGACVRLSAGRGRGRLWCPACSARLPLDGGGRPGRAPPQRGGVRSVVASFYALGAARRGLARASRGRARRRSGGVGESRARCGHPRGGAPARNRADRLDEPPVPPRRLDLAFDEALGRGLSALLVLAHAGGTGLGVVRARDEGRARLGGALRDRPIVTLIRRGGRARRARRARPADGPRRAP